MWQNHSIFGSKYNPQYLLNTSLLTTITEQFLDALVTQTLHKSETKLAHLFKII